jgi:hypothetical protein
MGVRDGLRAAAVRLWVLPTTLVGLVLASAALWGGRARMRSGVLEVRGGFLGSVLRRLPPFGTCAAAMALGHVILAMTEDDLTRHREHERVHVRQCERWGPLFLPAYAASSLLAWVRGADPYMGNVFEREAFAEDARLAQGRAGATGGASRGAGARDAG